MPRDPGVQCTSQLLQEEEGIEQKTCRVRRLLAREELGTAGAGGPTGRRLDGQRRPAQRSLTDMGLQAQCRPRALELDLEQFRLLLKNRSASLRNSVKSRDLKAPQHAASLLRRWCRLPQEKKRPRTWETGCSPRAVQPGKSRCVRRGPPGTPGSQRVRCRRPPSPRTAALEGPYALQTGVPVIADVIVL